MSRGTPDPVPKQPDFAYGAFTLFGRLSQNLSAIRSFSFDSPYPGMHAFRFGLLPLSLAATQGIEFSSFSSAYLDVSVQRVPFRTLWIHVRMTEDCSAGFPHSDICGSMDICS